jgi:phthalate 4,5-dioxygenase oxygenase subunit
MLSKAENELLCRIEGDAPMGRMLRQHWVPVCMSEELPEPGGAPKRVRLFGEDLVVFRADDGRVGLMDELCPHRRASLALGRNENCTLRCLYHGWAIDLEGNVVDMPSERPGSRLMDKVRQVAYPALEAGGFVWAYMGEAASMPEFEPPPWADKPDNSIAIAKIHEGANWVQSLEGSIDSAHSSTLHSASIRSDATVTGSTDLGGTERFLLVRPSVDKAPRLEVQLTQYGFRYAAIRKPILNAETTDYVRVTVYIAPFITLIPPHDTFQSAQVFVPLDDHNTMFYFVSWSDRIEMDNQRWRRDNHALPGVDLDQDFRKLRNRDNDYMQDRALMKQGDFTGIEGIPTQDMAMQETMGSIVDRTRENLCSSDVAIVRFRQMMLNAVKAFQDGAPALGREEPPLPQVRIRAFEGIVDKTANWRDFAVSEEERAGFRDFAVPLQRRAG